MQTSEFQATGPRRLLQHLLIGAAGILLTLLGVVGLLVPVMPGLVFLAGAVLCFSLVSPAFKARVGVHLFKQPGYRLARRRWNAGLGLPLTERASRAAWAGLAVLTRGSRPAGPGRQVGRESERVSRNFR